MTKPLRGIRVVDFGHYIAGPLAARLLCEAGASVVHIDPLSGPVYGNEHVNHLLNRGKDCIRLDLKSPNGIDRAWQHIEECDVVIENFTPGVMERLGLGAAEITKRNPHAIYLSLPGFASTDKEFQGFKALEPIIMAICGVYSDMGFNRVLTGNSTSYSPLPLASTYTSMIGALSVILALIEREKSGIGDIIEVPLASGLCECLVYNSIDVEVPKRYLTLRQQEIAKRKQQNLPMDLDYDQVRELLDPFYCTYTCGDGRPFYLVAPCHQLHQKRALLTLGLWEELCDIPQGDVYTNVDEWHTDIRTMLGTYPICDPVWLERLKTKMSEAFQQKSAAEWDLLFGLAKVPAAATLTTKEWLNSEHALSCGLVVERKDEQGRVIREAGPVVWHKSGEETEDYKKGSLPEVKNEVKSDEDYHRPAPCRWLEGTKVVDFCNVIAGPMIGGTLARFGADVIKVNPAKSNYDAAITVLLGIPANAGKRSMLANVKDKEDGNVIRERLIKWADVIVINQTEKQLFDLGCDEASLKKINPSVILMHFDAMGGPKRGPKSDCVGYDDITQATTGVMARFGGSIETPEEHAHIGTIDVVSGFAGAFSTCLALFKRKRTGVSDVARTSLAACGQLIQTPFMYDYEGRVFDEPAGPSELGEHSMWRWYSAKDQDIFVACEASKLKKALGELATCQGLCGIDLLDLWESDERKVGFELSKWIEDMNSTEALDVLTRVGVTAVRGNTMESLRTAFSKAPDLVEFGHSAPTFQFAEYKDHPIGKPLTSVAPCSVRSKNVSMSLPQQFPKFGYNTQEAMSDIGFSRPEIRDFLRRKSIATQWSNEYIPQGDPWKRLQPNELDSYVETCLTPPAKAKRGSCFF